MKKIAVFFVSLVLLVFSTVLVFATDELGRYKKFKDIPDGYWGQEAIDWGIEKGIISGYPDGSFKPNNYVTSAEWAAMKSKMLFPGKEDLLEEYKKLLYKKKSAHFDDVPPNHWAINYMYVNHYAIGGWIHEGRKSYWDKPVLRWQAIVSNLKTFFWYGVVVEDDSSPKGVVIKGIRENRVPMNRDAFIIAEKKGDLFLDLKEKTTLDVSRFGGNKFKDPYWDLELGNLISYVYDAYYIGLVDGFDDDTIRPNKPVTRIEAMMMLKRLYSVLDKEKFMPEIEDRLDYLRN